MKLFPSYENAQAAKRNCYPELSKMTFTETRAEVELQAMLDHTCQRLVILYYRFQPRGDLFFGDIFGDILSTGRYIRTKLGHNGFQHVT